MDYTDTVMDHFLNPRNMGEIENADGVGEVGNPRCGDVMKISLKIKSCTIIEIKFKTFGCAAAIATSSMATTLVVNKSIQEALQITNKEIIERLGGLPEIKHHCSVLAQQAVRAAMEDYCKKNNLDINIFLYKPVIKSV